MNSAGEYGDSKLVRRVTTERLVTIIVDHHANQPGDFLREVSPSPGEGFQFAFCGKSHPEKGRTKHGATKEQNRTG